MREREEVDSQLLCLSNSQSALQLIVASLNFQLFEAKGDILDKSKIGIYESSASRR